jgi:hypothetical protein
VNGGDPNANGFVFRWPGNPPPADMDWPVRRPRSPSTSVDAPAGTTTNGNGGGLEAELVRLRARVDEVVTALADLQTSMATMERRTAIVESLEAGADDVDVIRGELRHLREELRWTQRRELALLEHIVAVVTGKPRGRPATTPARPRVVPPAPSQGTPEASKSV